MKRRLKQYHFESCVVGSPSTRVLSAVRRDGHTKTLFLFKVLRVYKATNWMGTLVPPKRHVGTRWCLLHTYPTGRNVPIDYPAFMPVFFSSCLLLTFKGEYFARILATMKPFLALFGRFFLHIAR